MEVSKSLGGRKLFGPVDVMLGPGEKLGLLGENGSGKSTLLKIINGQLEPDSGQRKQAEKLQIVYFDQHREKLDLNLTLREALCPSGDKVIYKGNPIHVTGWAKRFLFNADQLDRPLVKFSGGEQARVMIAQLMLKPADILLLDEPTNDLDISSLEVLEQSLIEFPGALVLVTHDRYLLDRVSKQILALDGQGNSFFFADYEQWETWNTAQNQDAEKDFAEKKSARIDQKRRERLITTKELREWEGMETRIHAAEVVVSELKAALEDPVIATQAHTLMERQKELEQAEQKVEELFKRWDELGEKKKKAEKESS